jgi:hypothetical protein
MPISFGCFGPLSRVKKVGKRKSAFEGTSSQRYVGGPRTCKKLGGRMDNVLKNLQITTWYKAVIIVSAAAFLIALGTQRDALTMIFGGAFLIRIGEWHHHRMKTFERRPVAGGLANITDRPRKPNWFGIMLQLVGTALMAYGVYRAF